MFVQYALGAGLFSGALNMRSCLGGCDLGGCIDYGSNDNSIFRVSQNTH